MQQLLIRVYLEDGCKIKSIYVNLTGLLISVMSIILIYIFTTVIRSVFMIT